MRYDSNNEDTIYPDNRRKEDSPVSGTLESTDTSKRSQKQDHNWKNGAIGLGSGLIIGGISPFLMGLAPAGSDSDSTDPTNRSTLSNPEWVDDKIKVATNIEESMNFSEAFATARAEVGPGGCFEWHGKLYGTFLADEWNAMSSEEKAEFNNHFSWNHIDRSESHINPLTTNAASTPHPVTTENDNGTPNHNEDLVESSTVEGDHDSQEAHEIESQTVEVIDAATVNPEIEILGISYDAESGSNVGTVMMDGQEVILIDVDGDMDFDYMAINTASGEDPDADNIIDIQNHNLSVNDLGGLEGLSEPGVVDGFNDYSNDNY